MRRLIENIFQIYETDTAESKNALGELYFDLSASTVVSENKALMQFFQAPAPVVNHSLALKYFHLAESQNPSALLTKGRLALGLEAYFAANAEPIVQKKKELYQDANAYLMLVEEKHSGIIPVTICGNLGMWFLKNGQLDTARYWLYLLKESHRVKPILHKSQYYIMQNYRAAAIAKNQDNFKHFCYEMIQKNIPLSKETFFNYMRCLLRQAFLNQSDIYILSWMYHSDCVQEPDKKQITSKLAKHYQYVHNWLAAFHWAAKNGDGIFKYDIYKALNDSKSKWSIYLLKKYQITAGGVLMLLVALITMWLNMNPLPKSMIISLSAFMLVLIGCAVHYLSTIKGQRLGFLLGVCEISSGWALLSLLKAISHLHIILVVLLSTCVFSLAYLLILLSMPEMFKFVDDSFKAVGNLFPK